MTRKKLLCEMNAARSFLFLVALAEALQVIRKLSQQDDLAGQGLNIVLLSEGMDPIQPNARFSLVAEDVEYFDLFFAICHRLGLVLEQREHARQPFHQ